MKWRKARHQRGKVKAKRRWCTSSKIRTVKCRAVKFLGTTVSNNVAHNHGILWLHQTENRQHFEINISKSIKATNENKCPQQGCQGKMFPFTGDFLSEKPNLITSELIHLVQNRLWVSSFCPFSGSSNAGTSFNLFVCPVCPASLTTSTVLNKIFFSFTQLHILWSNKLMSTSRNRILQKKCFCEIKLNYLKKSKYQNMSREECYELLGLLYDLIRDSLYLSIFLSANYNVQSSLLTKLTSFSW